MTVYQFLEEESSQVPQMRWLAPVSRRPPSSPGKGPSTPGKVKTEVFPPRRQHLSPMDHRTGTEGRDSKDTRRPPDSDPQERAKLESFADARPGLANEPNLPAARLARPPAAGLPGVGRIPPRDRPGSKAPAWESAYPAPPEAPAPEGFSKTKTRHFLVYAEGEAASPDFIASLESLHANLMIDLAAFSPWARDQRVSIFLFRSQDSYRHVTGRPAWSGGASSVRKRKIYLYESEEVLGILAHELCHIYFDSFFLGGVSNPLWLSEGMATMVQTERGLSAPNWLKENLDTLHRGGGYEINDLVRIENTSGASDDEVRLWYTQAYSVVRFLLRSQYRSSFFRFCRYLREGIPLQDALHRSYGMPFNRVKALEYAWRHDLNRRKP